MTPSTFLKQFWGDSPPGKFYVYTLPNKESAWYTDYSTVDHEFRDQQGRDIYFGLSMLPKDTRTSRRKRLTLDSRMAGISCMWADLDWMDPAHDKKKLPPTREHILNTLSNLEYEPSIIVDSGHGLHVMWLFEKVWQFQDDVDQRQAAQLIFWWQAHIRAHYRAHEWELDSTHALTQILRIPGFMNLKREPHVPVTALTTDGPRHNLKLLLAHARRESPEEPPQYADARAQGQRTRRIKPVDTPQGNADLFGFFLDSLAEPPFDKLELALENIPNFKPTWENQRKDLYDTSASTHDLSLASMAARLNWTKQEIVNLLVAFRRRHNIPAKLRYDYYDMTLTQAMKPVQQDSAQTNLETLLEQAHYNQNPHSNNGNPDQPPQGSATDAADAASSPHIDPDTHQAIRENLSTTWNIEIFRFIKYTGPTPVYYISTAQGSGTIGSIRDLMNQLAFRSKIADITGKLIPPTKNKRDWDIRVQALLNIREEIDLGDVSYPDEQTMNWIKDYLQVRRPEDKDPVEARKLRLPYIIDGAVHINIYALKSFITNTFSMELPHELLAMRLRQLGATDIKTPSTSPTSAGAAGSYWRLPKSKVDYTQTVPIS